MIFQHLHILYSQCKTFSNNVQVPKKKKVPKSEHYFWERDPPCYSDQCLTTYWCNSFTSCHFSDQKMLFLCLGFTWSVLLSVRKTASSCHSCCKSSSKRRRVRSHGQSRSLIADPVLNTPLKSHLKTLKMQSNMTLGLKKCDGLRMSHGFIQWIPIHRTVASHDPCGQGLCVHMSAYAHVPSSVAVGNVSEEFSVRDEQGGCKHICKIWKLDDN